jgi:Mg2+ and Co2+ transporter CorA
VSDCVGLTYVPLTRLSLSLSLQAADVVQFFQNKIDTVGFLIHKKEAEENKRCKLLHDIELTELQGFRDSYSRIIRRLDAVIPQIQAIRTNFEARLAAQNGIKQQKLTEQLTWLSRIGVAVLPLNAVAGLFGMNVPVPWQGNTFCMCIVYAALMD